MWDTIQEGVDDANPGDLVFIHGGTYAESVVVSVPLIIEGEDESSVVVDGGSNCISIASGSVSVANCTLTNATGNGIYVQSGDLSLDGVTIYGCGGYGIWGRYPGALTLNDCTIANSGGGVLWGESNPATGNVTVDRCTISDNTGGDGLSLRLAVS